jgi:hypothetical protein
MRKEFRTLAFYCIQYRVHSSPLLGPIMNQMNSVYTVTSHFFRIYFNIIYTTIYALVFQVVSSFQVL